MRLARVLGAIGRGLISTGVLVLLFVAYQLWGTGIQHAQAQGNLEDDFAELLESDLAAEAQGISEAVEAARLEATIEPNDPEVSGDEAEPNDPDDPATTLASLVEVDLSDIEFSPQFLSVLYPDDGRSLARIVIADISVDEIVVEGVSVEDLRKGPGHYGSTPNPGQAGNAAIAGHRTTYGAPFHRIDELSPGAEIVVTTIQGTFVYRVTENVATDGSIKGHFIVSPSDTWVLGQTDENLLTLTACHPKYSARQRIIVQAELVGAPAPTIPRDEAAGLEPVEISAGAEDERASEADDSQVVIGDGAAADDDPGVDGDGVATDDDPNGDDDADEVASAATGVAGGPTEDDPDAGVAASADDPDDADIAAAADGPGDAVQTEDLTGEDIELTAAQTPFDDADDFGEGLNGDPTKIQPAILWGLASLSIWLAAWFVGKRLNRKWTLYAVGLAPFALVLWACFVNVDQALPSY